MRHMKKGRKLNRTSSHRIAMFRNMATSLFKHEKIETTDKKAKELRRFAEKLITVAKAGTIHSKRECFKDIRDLDILHKLCNEIAPRYKERPGGYTRISKVYIRKGDNTVMSKIELVGSATEETVQIQED